jgi:N-acetyl-anhydromuramyl-L-alanine amidase AmpD
MYEIKQVPSKNRSSRAKSIPIAIVNHITAGSLRSVDSWFTSPDNDQSSAHFCIGRNGEIHQYVDIKERAWHAGLAKGASQHATADIIKRFKNVNPNAYTIGIEHEGYKDNGIDGTLTEEQFWASVWLHRYIREEVKKIYGRYIDLNPANVIGHFQVDPRRKPNCPGKNFPWDRLYKELQFAENLTLQELEMRIAYRKSDENILELANAILFRINDLRNKVMYKGKFKELAADKLRKIEKLLTEENLM